MAVGGFLRGWNEIGGGFRLWDQLQRFALNLHFDKFRSDVDGDERAASDLANDRFVSRRNRTCGWGVWWVNLSVGQRGSNLDRRQCSQFALERPRFFGRRPSVGGCRLGRDDLCFLEWG